jgi:rubrerythrin
LARVQSIAEEEERRMTRQQSQDFPSQRGVPGLWWEEDYRDADFMRRAIPISTWDERLLAHIDNHLVLEADASSEYDSLAEMGDPQIRYLAGLIAADEHRHHAMLLALATSIRSKVCDEGDELGWSKPAVLTSEQRHALLTQTRRLLDVERDDVAKLKELQRDVRPAPDGTLWPELIEIMSLDTEKHIHILKAIERKLKRH